MRLEQPTTTLNIPYGLIIDSMYRDMRSVNLDHWAFGLMTMVSTMNPSAAALESWGRYFPQSTTTVLVSREIAPERQLVDIKVCATTPDRIRDALRYLGLTKTQLKDICSVSRQTLYDWLAERFEPDATNGARLRDIHELALIVPQYSRRPVRTALLTQPVLGAASLLDMLREPRLDMPMLREIVIALAAKSDLAKKRSASALRERLGFKQRNPESGADNLADSVEDLEKK